MASKASSRARSCCACMSVCVGVCMHGCMCECVRGCAHRCMGVCAHLDLIALCLHRSVQVIPCLHMCACVRACVRIHAYSPRRHARADWRATGGLAGWLGACVYACRELSSQLVALLFEPVSAQEQSIEPCTELPCMHQCVGACMSAWVHARVRACMHTCTSLRSVSTAACRACSCSFADRLWSSVPFSTCTCMLAYTLVRTHACIHMWVRVYMHASERVRASSCVCACMHMCAHACVYAWVCANGRAGRRAGERADCLAHVYMCLCVCLPRAQQPACRALV